MPAVFALADDKTKTPVDLGVQTPGTKMVALLQNGRDVPFTVTGAHIAAPGTVKAAIARYRGRSEQ